MHCFRMLEVRQPDCHELKLPRGGGGGWCRWCAGGAGNIGLDLWFTATKGKSNNCRQTWIHLVDSKIRRSREST